MELTHLRCILLTTHLFEYAQAYLAERWCYAFFLTPPPTCRLALFAAEQGAEFALGAELALAERNLLFSTPQLGNVLRTLFALR